LGLETRPAAWSLLRQACLVSESPGISAGNVSISFIPHRFAGLIDDGAKLKYLVGKTSGEGGRETRPERKKRRRVFSRRATREPKSIAMSTYKDAMTSLKCIGSRFVCSGLSNFFKPECHQKLRAFRLTCCPLSRRRLDQNGCASLTSNRSGGRDGDRKQHSGNVVQNSRERDNVMSLPRNSSNTESTKSTSCTALALVRNQVLIYLRKLFDFSQLA
jgi:hypothetical protein